MPAGKTTILAIILSFFLVSGTGMLLFGHLSNAGFGTGFIAAAILVFLYTILQQRKSEQAGEAPAGNAISIAGRAAYSTVALSSAGACFLAIAASAMQWEVNLDLFKTLGALAGSQFFIFIWLFVYYQKSLKEQ